MNDLDFRRVEEYVNDNIGVFHQSRLNRVSRLKLSDLLKKNPYLFRAKNIHSAGELIRDMMDAFLSSSEEKIFGDFLEGLAIFVCQETLGGHKSSAPGVDLEFRHPAGTYYLISIKSGPNWGNSSQHDALARYLMTAVNRLRQSSHIHNVQPTLGICYGKVKSSFMEKGYLKVVGQNFWTLISGNQELYKEIIEPVGYRAKEHNDTYEQERGRIENMLTAQFTQRYCDSTGVIQWAKLVEDNSGNFDLDLIFGQPQ